MNRFADLVMADSENTSEMSTTGANVMITIFGDYLMSLMVFFLKTNDLIFFSA
jgi:hypothetical protein